MIEYVVKVLSIKNKLLYFILPNAISILKNKIKYKNTPSVQQIVICNGSGNVIIGENCVFGYKKGGFHKGGSIELQARYEKSQIKIGKNVATNNNIMFCAANYIEIGDDTLIGQYVTIMDHEAHSLDPDKRREIGEIGKVIIGKNVWLGNNVVILKNSQIGDNSIVATGAVVSGSFPSNVIIGGVPAKIIKSL
ncbi:MULTISPECIES: acyltransferase [Flavobacterium]|uniref:acyltransferase n=1 Tax=Flavobacterium TaxID=237 RepID=UPI00164301B9|nr:MULTISPECIES: acyltransferase [Flavobacterium]MCR4030914.1 acyltransferase [Flavobacterium panacis]